MGVSLLIHSHCGGSYLKELVHINFFLEFLKGLKSNYTEIRSNLHILSGLPLLISS